MRSFVNFSDVTYETCRYWRELESAVADGVQQMRLA